MEDSMNIDEFVEEVIHAVTGLETTDDELNALNEFIGMLYEKDLEDSSLFAILDAYHSYTMD